MNNKKNTILLVILLSLSMSMVFLWNVTAYDPKPSQVTIAFWYTENDAEKPIVLEKIAKFEAQNPLITVTATQHGFFGVGDEFATAFIAGTEPDVLRTPRDDVIRFAYDGLIHPLTDEFTTYDLNDFIPASLQLMTYAGEIWGFPQAIDCPMFMFNKHLFDVAGIPSHTISFNVSWTWSEFDTNIALLNATAGVYALSLQGMFYGAQPYYYGHGAQFLERYIYDTKHIDVDSTKSRMALQYIKNLTDSTLTPPWVEQGWGNYIPDFGNGKVAMVATGPWEITNLLTNYPQFNGTSYGASNLGFMLLPHDADGNQGALVGGNYYTISSQTAQYDAALKLTQFLSSENMMVLAGINNSHVPARLSAMANTTFIASPSFQYVEPYFNQCLNAHLLTPAPFYGQMENVLGGYLDQYLADQISLDSLLTSTIAEWNDILPGWGKTEQVTVPGFEISLVLGILITGTLGIVIYSMRKRR
ncbi:MAG: extracellular solute-binding protein [Promethearchaeota archaeon]